MSEERTNGNSWVEIVILALLIVLVTTSSVSLTAADWTDSLKLIPTIGILGVLLSAWLARSRLHGAIAALVMTLAGIVVVLFQIGRTFEPGLLWRDKLVSIYERIVATIDVISRGEPNLDSLLFVLMLAVLYWLFGVISAWRVFRNRGFWVAALLPGIALLVNAYYYIGPVHLDLYLAFYLLVALLLAMSVEHLNRQDAWNLIRAKVPPNLLLKIGRAGFLAALALILLAWATPALARTQQLSVLWDSLNDPFTEAGEWFSDLFASLQVSEDDVSDFYGSELRLESGQDPGVSLVMEVHPDGVPSRLGRFYWRAQVYDQYQSGMWKATLGENRSFNPNDGDLPLPAYAAREEFEVLFIPATAVVRQIYLPSQPLWVDRVSQVRLVEVAGVPVDALTVSVRGIVFRSEGYNTRASVAVPTGFQLSQAGEDYPQWVTDHYLQLPRSITQATIDLAAEITEGLESPYRKAVAITAWLRSSFTYSRNTDAPPALRDPVEWFLFDYKIGFCNYYASAEVLMLRSLGIPARLSTGYARGTLDASTGIYSVDSRDAHAWPEVFFPGYGWIEFEPTPNQPPLYRPEGALTTDSENAEPAEGEAEDAGDPALVNTEDDNLIEEGPEIAPDTPITITILTWLRYLLLALPVLLAVTVVLISLSPALRSRAKATVRQLMERLGVDPPQALKAADADQSLWQTVAGRVYARWSRWLPRLGIEIDRSQTPSERQAAFRVKVPEAAELGQAIVQAYTLERYGGLEVDSKQVRQVWWRLLPELWRAWFRWQAKRREKKIYVPGRLLR
jgi:transglutaminase-like putative cysteine protease